MRAFVKDVGCRAGARWERGAYARKLTRIGMAMAYAQLERATRRLAWQQEGPLFDWIEQSSEE